MKALFTTTLLFCCILCIGQSLKVKDGDIIFKSDVVLQYEIVSPVKYSVSNLTGAELFTLEFHDNNTPKKRKDDFFILSFGSPEYTIESDKTYYVTHGKGKDPEKNLRRLLHWMVLNNVLDKEGNLIDDELQEMVDKYDEDIEPEEEEEGK